MIEDETLQRSSLMADQQDRPDEKPDAAPPAPAPEFSDGARPSPPPPPATPPPTPPPPPAAKKAPAKKAKKAPAKTPKKLPAKAAKKSAPAKKAAKKAAAKKAAPKPPAAKAAPKLADTNGDRNIANAAKQAAAQAKSTVAEAGNPVTGPRTIPLVEPGQSRLPIAAAIAAGVLAILLVLLARRHGDDD
jgi:hypothetical protein